MGGKACWYLICFALCEEESVVSLRWRGGSVSYVWDGGNEKLRLNNFSNPWTSRDWLLFELLQRNVKSKRQQKKGRYYFRSFPSKISIRTFSMFYVSTDPSLPYRPSPSPDTFDSWHFLPQKMLLSVIFKPSFLLLLISFTLFTFPSASYWIFHL